MISWFTSSILMSISIGFVGFINKVIVEKKYDQKLSAILFYLTQVIIYTIAFFYVGNYQISLPIIFFGFLWGILDYVYFKTRFISLQGISASLFFISSRLFSSIVLLFLGIIVFGDNISLYEYIGFFIGFIVFGLLFEKEKIINVNYNRGLIFLGIGIILLIVVHFGIKYVSTILNNIYLLFFSYAITAFLTSVFIDRKHITYKVKDFSNIVYLNILHASLFAFYIYFLFNAYNLADLGIVYKIQSYSIFIPIILSIIIYKEKLTYKKIIAFILTLISLWFFA